MKPELMGHACHHLAGRFAHESPSEFQADKWATLSNIANPASISNVVGLCASKSYK